MDTLVQETPTATLTAHDRCDRCGSQAYVRVGLITGDLLFCGHHATRNEAKLREVAITFQDERARLTPA